MVVSTCADSQSVSVFKPITGGHSRQALKHHVRGDAIVTDGLKSYSTAMRAQCVLGPLSFNVIFLQTAC